MPIPVHPRTPDEYPQTYEMQKRCVNMLSRLWNAPLAPEEGNVFMRKGTG